MFRGHVAIGFGVLALCVSTSALAAPLSFVVDDPGGRNTAAFESRAPLETVSGQTQGVTGTIALDPGDLMNGASGSVTVDLEALKTGIDLRDKHMRAEDYLDTAKYPTAIFTVGRVVSASRTKLADGESADLVVAGTFQLHGVSREIQVPVTLTYKKEIPELAKMGYPGDLAAVRTSFEIKLQDHGIARPQFLILKLDETIRISVQFTGATGRSKTSAE